MNYIDGFVAAVPAGNKEAYRKHAADAAPIFHEFGVRRVVEAWGDDVPKGETTDFYGAVNAEPGEIIVFSWMEHADRAARDAAGQKMMNDERMSMADMPFDGKRMIYGGFAVINAAGPGGKPGYVDGVLIPVTEGNRQAYIDGSRTVASMLIENGALRAIDAWGDDTPDGKITDFRRAVKAEQGEAVVFSWVEWPTKAARDAAWEKLGEDPRMAEATQSFNARRMVTGGFVPIVDA